MDGLLSVSGIVQDDKSPDKLLIGDMAHWENPFSWIATWDGT